jgi:hypothetical protein
MRVVEKCNCGANIEVVWTEAKSAYDTQHLAEARSASRELAAFRRRHAKCSASGPSS